MMGGADIQVPGGVDRGDIDFVLRFLRLAWPNGILDDGTGTPAPLRALATHNLGHEEYFVYERLTPSPSGQKKGSQTRHRHLWST